VAAHIIQLGQDRQAGIHPPINAVLCACLFGLIEGTGGDLGGDALLPADFVQVVDGWVDVSQGSNSMQCQFR
jgi:hypothetical protein